MASISPMLGRPAGSNGEETRRRIIEATMRCVAEVGYSRATIREIARMAEMTSGSLYHYFPNKAELVKETVAEYAEMTVPRLAEVAGREGHALAKLLAVLDECDAVMNEFPYVAAFDRAIRAESSLRVDVINSDAVTMTTTLHTLAEDIIKQAKREGTLSPGTDVASATNAIYTVIRGSPSMRRWPRRPTSTPPSVRSNCSSRANWYRARCLGRPPTRPRRPRKP